MPETISPVTREEDYLAAIAGQDVTPPTPVTRKEEWLDLIADKVDDLAGDIEDLQDVVPTPEAADSGKVLTAGADGTATWADVPEELPASLGTAGQVLTVNAGATGVEWATPSGGGGGVNLAEVVTISKTIDGHAYDSSTTNINIDEGGGSSVTYTPAQYKVADVKADAFNLLIGENYGYTTYTAVAAIIENTASAPTLPSEGFWLAEGQKYYDVAVMDTSGSFVQIAQTHIIPPDARIVYVSGS